MSIRFPRISRAQLAAVRVLAHDAERQRLAAERPDVVHGVRAAAQAHVARLVLQDQHRRLAADALDTAVHELVRHQVGEHQHAPATEGADQGLEPRGLAHAASRPRIRSTASSRFSATRSGERCHVGPGASARRGRSRSSRARPWRRRSRPARRSEWRSPITHELARSAPSSACARRSSPGRGLRQSQSRRYGGWPTLG